MGDGLESLLSSAHPKLYLLHHNADPDGIGAAFALARAFGGDIGAAKDVSAQGERLAKLLGVRVLVDPDPAGYALVVIVDASTPGQLGTLFPHVGRHAVVDHHATSDFPRATERLLDPSRSSTCEVVYDWFRAHGRAIGPDVATALLAGLVVDSAQFRFGDARTLRAAADLSDRAGTDVGTVLSRIEEDDRVQDRSLRIAQLKAAQRLRLFRVGRFVVATSEVASFEAAASRVLVRAGADVALVGAQRGAEARVSGRADRDALEAGLDLAMVLHGVARSYPSGGGGGHAGASGLNVEAGVGEVLERCLRGVGKALQADPVEETR
ncbi:MAG: DHH family phosphoesterase [Methanobacteriota archaeon]